MAVSNPTAQGTGRPIIGYDNIVTAANISTDTNPAADFPQFPLSAVATPDTYTAWVGEYPYFHSPVEFPVLLLHMDGADASTSFPDASGNSQTITPHGNVQVDTAQSQFGGASALFTSLGDYLTGDGGPSYNLLSDFTVDFWIRRSATQTHELFTIGDNTTAAGFSIVLDNANHLNVFHGGGGVIAGTTAVAISTWAHVALTRASGSWRLFLNGVQEGSTFVNSDQIFAHAGSPWIGQHPLGFNQFAGHMDEVRICLGALWTAGFVPPAAPFTVRDRSIMIKTPATADNPINYVGIVGDLTADQIQIETITSPPVSLLHFDGSNDFDVVDDSPIGPVWFTVNAMISRVAQRFGIASLVCDGTGDYIIPDGTPAGFAFGSGNFTVDFWYFPAVLGTTHVFYDSRPSAVSSGAYLTIYKATNNTVRVFVNGADILVSGATVTSLWNHIAVARSGGTTRLFLNGVFQQAVSDSTVYLNALNRPTIGAQGAATTGNNSVNGFIDEMRVLNTAAWTSNSNFTPATTAYDPWTVTVPFVATSGNVSIIRFPTTLGGYVKVKIKVPIVGLQPQIRSLYAGEILELEKGVRAEVPHIPISYGRKTSTINGMSESGNFLGRIVLSEWRESQAEFFGFTRDFFVNSMVPFLANAKEFPFFFAYAPTEYPTECGYVWLTKDPEPEILPSTRSYALTLDMRGVA